MSGHHRHSSNQHPVIKFLGSIQLAVPLLGAIAAILIGTTFYESRVGSDIVQGEIYKSGWFGLLMLLLAVNLSVSALTRFPWRGARKIGFALTHFGLVVLIAGSAAVIHLGVEGMLPLRTDMAANTMLRLQGELLEVMQPDGTISAVDVARLADGTIPERTVGGLKLLDYRDRTFSLTRFKTDGEVSNPALHLSLASQNMGQSVEEWLAATPSSAQQVNLGPATLKLVVADTDADRLALMTAPAQVAGKWGTLAIASQGKTIEFDVEQSVGQTLKLSGNDLSDNIQVNVVNFWPDFRLNSRNEPETVSEQLRNPALQLQVESPTGVERWFVFGQANLDPVRTLVAGNAVDATVTYQAPTPEENVFTAIASSDGQLYYTVNSSKGFQSGILPLDTPVDLGWADFQLTVTDWLPRARIEREVVEVSQVDNSQSANAIPAVLVESPSGDRQWLQWGEPQALSNPNPDNPNGELFAIYSPKSMELPFAVALEDFIVERNEGAESVAMWTSQIRIDDPELGQHAFRKVWMNHPTWYRGWKIAQASWNPGDLRQSTLQVKREPAWVTALTWTGSMLVVAGIGVMFYGQELARRYRKFVSQFRNLGSGTAERSDAAIAPATNQSPAQQPPLDATELSPQTST
ncbi:MAG: cytochrome C biogenesis protein [Synechococcus sp.]